MPKTNESDAPAPAGGTDRAGAASAAAPSAGASPDTRRSVMQVERLDFTDLVPTDRPRMQPLDGFDPEYTDIVDYIVRCTHRIWDERNVGLIYTHYAANAIVHSSLGTSYSREEVIQATIRRIAEDPTRNGFASQVIWTGDDRRGFYTSHLVTSVGRHTEAGAYGPPTGRRWVARTVADCLIYRNRVYREWLVRDNMAHVRQLGLDPHPIAEKMARTQLASGRGKFDVGEDLRMIGQYPPGLRADTSAARSETERRCVEWMHQIYNRRMFGLIREIYAPQVQWHGPGTTELYGIASVMQAVIKLVAMITDAQFVVHHVCSTPNSVEGGEKVAIRWIMRGHHLGHGSLGAPTGHGLFVMGMTHLHVVDGRIVEEWTLYDELAMLAQIKLAEMIAEKAA